MKTTFGRMAIAFIFTAEQFCAIYAQASPFQPQANQSLPVLPLPAPASPVPLNAQIVVNEVARNNEIFVPLSPTPINGLILPATQYAATYNYPGLGDITYSRMDVLVQNAAEKKAVLQFAAQLSGKSDRTQVLDFTTDDAAGDAQNRKLISIMPLSLRSHVHEIGLPRHLMAHVERKAYENFESARDQYLTQNYSRFVRWGTQGKYKNWFSIARFSGNAVGSFLSVIANGAPMIGKLSYAVATGAMSAALMYYNNHYMSWLTHQGFVDWINVKTRRLWPWLGISPHKILQYSDETSAVTKWNLIEFGFMGVQATLLKLMGTPMANSFSGYVWKGGLAMVLGFLAQYSWDKANSELWDEYNRYVTDPNDRAFYETYSALKMVLVSWGQTTAVSVALVYPRIGWPMLGIMAAMGFEFRRVANHTTPDELISKFTSSAFRY